MSDQTPRTARAWQAEGASRYRAGDLAGAEDALRAAAGLEPAEIEYLCNLAELARVAGRSEAARDWLDKAEAAAPENPDKLNLLAAAWLDLGVPSGALRVVARALEAGGGPESRLLFVSAIRAEPRLEYRDLVARALRESWASGQALAMPAVALLRAAWPNSVAALEAEEILPQLLETAVLADSELERRLTALRRQLLLAAPGAPLTAVRAGLAIQCSLNGYAWREADDETAAVAALSAKVANGAAEESEVLTLASYRALSALPDPDVVFAVALSDPAARVVHEQVVARQDEAAIARALPTLTPIRAGTSAEVQRQYEESPYPRWTKISAGQRAPIGRLLRQMFPMADLPATPETPEVLIAGCGTGRHALNAALGYAGARVLGVDLSRASLAYGARKAREARADNLQFAQADLLELGGLDRRFDVIECVGVLHHLADPFEGARVLAGLLRPGGLMKVGVYSALARAILAPAKAVASRFPRTPEGVRAARAAILDAPQGDPAREVLRAGDFFTLAGCRDLLMHVQEHEMTLADVGRMADENGLRLLGLAVSASDRAAYQQMFPHDPKGVDLEAWAEFERQRPQTFIGMYQAWMAKPA